MKDTCNHEFYRVVARTGKTTEVSGLSFTNFGAHHDNYPCSYLTAAAAVGMARSDVDTFISKLDQCLAKYRKTHSIPLSLTHVTDSGENHSQSRDTDSLSKDDDNS